MPTEPQDFRPPTQDEINLFRRLYRPECTPEVLSTELRALAVAVTRGREGLALGCERKTGACRSRR